MAESTDDNIVVDNLFVIKEWPDPLARLPALAERLGVAECKPTVHTVRVQTKDGKQYDLFDLANAFLDKLDDHVEQDKHAKARRLAETIYHLDEISVPLLTKIIEDALK